MKWWRNTKEMPFLLRLFCQGGMAVAPILLCFVLLPVTDWTVNGRTMSYVDLWKSGAGVSMVVFLTLLLVGTWGLAARNPRSRWALVFAPVAPYAILLVFPWSSQFSSESTSGDILAQAIVAGAIIYACLFHLQAVRKYLALHEASA
jgi:hypothetical protein